MPVSGLPLVSPSSSSTSIKIALIALAAMVAVVCAVGWRAASRQGELADRELDRAAMRLYGAELEVVDREHWLVMANVHRLQLERRTLALQLGTDAGHAVIAAMRDRAREQSQDVLRLQELKAQRMGIVQRMRALKLPIGCAPTDPICGD